MRDPFEQKKHSRGWGKLLDLDSWIDSSLYSLFSEAGETWENITIFFRRFKVSGWKKGLVELTNEALTLGFAGSVLMLALALPAFEATEKNWRDQADYSIIFYDRYGKKIGERGIRQNESGNVDALPDHFIKAVLATEDRRFFEHFGIDFFGLVRALAENVRANSVVQGGSTITQQLAKNLFLTNERSLNRKIKEAFLSVWLEWNLSKKEILKFYLDRAYMGAGNFGVAAAADYYFGKSIRDVTIAEAAMLAGLYKAPSKYSPHLNLPAARARANEVLTNMVQAGFMTEGQVVGARKKPAEIVERNVAEGPNYFLDWAFEEVKKLSLRFKTRSLRVKTTVDLDLQKAAENAIETHLSLYGKDYGVSQAAMVAIEHDGSLRALVGGRDYGLSQFNRATRSLRQPGSSFKPFVYAASMEYFGYDENTKVTDGSVCLNRFGRTWCPRNYSGGFRGRTNFTTALVKSINTVPVRLYVGGYDGLKGLGGKRITTIARKMGITAPLVENPPMVLGANGITALEMATGYGTFVNAGYKMHTHTVSQIHDSAGTLLYDFKKDGPKKERALKDETVASMNTILSQIPEWGTGRRAKLEGIKTAGKTGTTQAYRDAWFVGFTGNFVASVWFGNDNYKSTKRLTGGRLPAMTWKKFMTYAHQNIELRPIPFVEPEAPKSGKPIKKHIVNNDADQLEQVARPKTLNSDAQQALIELEKKLLKAKPIEIHQRTATADGDRTNFDLQSFN